MFYLNLAQQKSFSHFVSIYHATLIERKKFLLFVTRKKTGFYIFLFIKKRAVFSFMSFLIQLYSNCNASMDNLFTSELLGFIGVTEI